MVNSDDIFIRHDIAHSPKVIYKTLGGVKVNCPGKTNQKIYVKSMTGVSNTHGDNYFDTNLSGVK